MVQAVENLTDEAGHEKRGFLNGGAGDADGDGIPDSWETLFSHNRLSAKDANSDFDFDGLTALQEYQLHSRTNGDFGNPLGTYELVNAPAIPGYASPPNISLVESASNGMSVVRVTGVLAGASNSSTRVYTYDPGSGLWTHVLPPSGITAALTAFDVNSLGQVIGFYSSGGAKGFLWTPSTTASGGGASVQFFIKASATVSTPAIPRRISDSGYLLYSTSTSSAAPLLPADAQRRPITPVPNIYQTTRYVDVNDFGEYVGTVYNPLVGERQTFLSVPEGPFFLAEFSDSSVGDIGLAQPPVVDVSEINWGPYDFSNYVGGYDYARYGRATDSSTQQAYDLRETYWGKEIWWKLPGSSTWVKFDFNSSPAVINDWGEFGGSFTLTSTNAYHSSYQGYDEYPGSGQEFSYSNQQSGAFVFDGEYALTLSGTKVFGVSNDPQALIGNVRSDRLWSDGVVAPLAKLLPVGSPAPLIGRICDNGVLVFQTGAQTLQILRPSDDQDGDGMPDDWEAFHGFNVQVPDAHLDADGDGRSNLVEFRLGTDPNMAPVYVNGAEVDVRPGIDTDGDGMPNLWELQNGMNYLDASDAGLDFDRDGYTNLQEFRLGTDPRGAPVYRATSLGPFTGASAVSNLMLADAVGSSNHTGFIGDELIESVVMTGTAANPAADGFRRPAAWSFSRADSSKQFRFFERGALTANSNPVAQASNGASISSASGGFYYWANPTADPIFLSGAPAAHNVASISTPRFSPSGTFLVGTRRLASQSSSELFIWKMPSEGQLAPKPVRLLAPAGASISLNATLHVNDLGQVAATGTVWGQTRPILWELSSNGLTVTSPVMQAVEGARSHSVAGISNSFPLRIAGTAGLATGEVAVVWDSSGSVTTLSAIPNGTTSAARLVSEDGKIAGIATVASGEVLLRQPFIASFDAFSNAWKVQPQGEPGNDFTLTRLNDMGELLGSTREISPVNRLVPTLWRHGKSHALDGILPQASGHVIESVTSINRGGTLLATTWFGGARTQVILTPDQDTDGDGMPDAFENRHGFNPLVKNPATADSDADGLSDYEEFRNGTDPRNPDSDGDGMKDGWEVAWGLLPLDPADAGLDPDEDRVTNLRESQLNTNPTGLYRVEVIASGVSPSPIVAVNDSGNLIYSGSSTWDSDPLMIGPDWFEQRSTTPHFLDQVANVSGGGRIVHPLLESGSVGRFNSSRSISDNRSEYAYHHLGSTGSNVHTSIYGYTYNGLNGNYVYEEYAYLVPSDLREKGMDKWITWGSVEERLRSVFIPVLEAAETLSPYSTVVSKSGTRRVHRTSQNRQLLLTERGEFISDLGSLVQWQKVTDRGQVFALVVEQRMIEGGSTAIQVPTLKIGNFGNVETLDLPHTTGINDGYSLHAVSEDGLVLLSRNLSSEQAGVYRIYERFDTGSGQSKRLRQPGLGQETLTGLSSTGGRVLGSGPKPFQITPDGTCIRLDALRIQNSATDPSTPLGSLYPGPLIPAHITPQGVITFTTTNAQNQTVILQATRHNDANNNGIPDDWEKDFAEWVLEADRTLNRLTAEQKAELQSGQLDPNADYTGDQLNAADQAELSAIPVDRYDLAVSRKYDFVVKNKFFKSEPLITLIDKLETVEASIDGRLSWSIGKGQLDQRHDEDLQQTMTPVGADFSIEEVDRLFDMKFSWQQVEWEATTNGSHGLKCSSSYYEEIVPENDDAGNTTKWQFFIKKTKFMARRQGGGNQVIEIPVIEVTTEVPMGQDGKWNHDKAKVTFNRSMIVIGSGRMNSNEVELNIAIKAGKMMLKELLPLDTRVYRPLEVQGALRWLIPRDERKVPEPELRAHGARIRVNGDGDDGGQENDLIQVELDVQLPTGSDLVIKRSNENLNVYSDRKAKFPILTSANEEVLTNWSSPPPHRFWVEARDFVTAGGISFEFRAKGSTDKLEVVQIPFRTYSTVVAALSGETAFGGDPYKHGSYDIALSLYNMGYNVHCYAESEEEKCIRELDNQGKKCGVQSVAIFGYSHGGGSTYRIAKRSPGSLDIKYTGYIDAVTNTSLVDFTKEDRRPPGSKFHFNYYQTNGLCGAPSIPAANLERDLTSATVDHKNIHKNPTVTSDLISFLKANLRP